MTTRWKPTVTVLAAVLSLIAGCGDDGDSGEVRNLGTDGAATSSSAAGGGVTTSSMGGESPEACEVEGGVTTKGKQEVTVVLNEWQVAPQPAQVTPGIVSFVAENTGAEAHELVIVKGDDPRALPKDDKTGAMDEEQLPDGALVGEIEGFPAGQLCAGNFTLQEGKYVLLCNIVETEEDGTSEAHYSEGMFTGFTVG